MFSAFEFFSVCSQQSFLVGYNLAMKTALVIIAQQGYQDHELDGTLRHLKNQGFAVTLASAKAAECTGKFGGKQQATLALKDVDVSLYDRIAFIGGPGAVRFADDPQAHRIARETAAAGRILGAICIAPTILAKAGVLLGKRATVWDSGGEQVRMLQDGGAVYSGEDVTVDDRLVTANGPQAADLFGQRFATLSDDRSRV